jgi:hypothetical protein
LLQAALAVLRRVFIQAMSVGTEAYSAVSFATTAYQATSVAEGFIAVSSATLAYQAQAVASSPGFQAVSVGS